MRLYRTLNGIFVEEKDSIYPVNAIGWDELIVSVDLHKRVRAAMEREPIMDFNPATILAPAAN